ncbi:hypothetical protein ACQKP8_26805 [Photobacterium alginatilyticum]|uniref:hypothetical protein n=1 Tax=Photobacterium alginatilyticum TaxID=1775171 RepID=UPI0040679D9B
MKQLIRQREIVSFKLVHTIAVRAMYGSMFAYYLVALANEPFKYQIGYIALFVVISVVMDYLVANRRQSAKIEIDDGRFNLLGSVIELSQINEILYFQTKRFEHTVRFRYRNSTYQDFELSESDLIEELRFYQFLIDNKLPVKMLDSGDRLS